MSGVTFLRMVAAASEIMLCCSLHCNSIKASHSRTYTCSHTDRHIHTLHNTVHTTLIHTCIHTDAIKTDRDGTSVGRGGRLSFAGVAIAGDVCMGVNPNPVLGKITVGLFVLPKTGVKLEFVRAMGLSTTGTRFSESDLTRAAESIDTRYLLTSSVISLDSCGARCHGYWKFIFEKEL